MNDIDMYEDLTQTDIMKILERDTEDVEIETLYELTKHYENIGYLYTTKKYSNRENKYEVYSIYDRDISIENIYFILLFDMKQETEYRLTNIIIDNNNIFTHEQLLTYNPELIQYFDKPNIKPSKLSSESDKSGKSSESSESG